MAQSHEETAEQISGKWLSFARPRASVRSLVPKGEICSARVLWPQNLHSQVSRRLNSFQFLLAITLLVSHAAISITSSAALFQPTSGLRDDSAVFGNIKRSRPPSTFIVVRQQG